MKKQTNQSAASEWVSLPLAAQYLGKTWAQAYTMALRGDLEAELRGSRWVISRRSLEQYREADRV